MAKEDQSLVPEGEGLLSGGPVLMIVLSIGADSKFAWVPPVLDAVGNETHGRLDYGFQLKVDRRKGRKVPCRCLNT